MAEITFHHGPNRAITSAAPGDTAWHKLALPVGLPSPSGVVNAVVAVCTLAAAGGAGSVAFLNFDQVPTPTSGWPLLTTEAFGLNNNIWYQLTTGTDTIYFLFSW